jgi:predicted phage terminase large subunit-like protein
MRAASNPYGPGLEWCHRRFIVGADQRDRIFIPARLDDNPHLDESYERSLKELGPTVYRQLRHGDWTVNPEGGLFKAEWFEGCMIERRELPERLRLCRFWDLAATETTRGSDPDYTAGVLLGICSDGFLYVVHVTRERATPHGVEQLIVRTAERDRAWAKERGLAPPMIRIEQEPGSAGVTVIDHYRRSVLQGYAFKGMRSTGSKEVRATPVASRAEAGDIRICRGSWNTAFLDELTAFPLGTHDDQLDAISGAYQALTDRRTSPFTPMPIGIWQPNYWSD